MLLECTECQLPYYTYADLRDHQEMTHPTSYRMSRRWDVRLVRRILNKHQKTYRCKRCFMPFAHPALRDEHEELEECDFEDDSYYEYDVSADTAQTADDDCEQPGVRMQGKMARIARKLHIRRRLPLSLRRQSEGGVESGLLGASEAFGQ
ncbi:hypothetical protein MKEN_01372200 [Mycena kentingensis (nom. inval.)]|nr:hypothetical protein MKEN_01372200 [Mycena kentingensis (nom. inval.)]